MSVSTDILRFAVVNVHLLLRLAFFLPLHPSHWLDLHLILCPCNRGYFLYIIFTFTVTYIECQNAWIFSILIDVGIISLSIRFHSGCAFLFGEFIFATPARVGCSCNTLSYSQLQLPFFLLKTAYIIFLLPFSFLGAFPFSCDSLKKIHFIFSFWFLPNWGLGMQLIIFINLFVEFESCN